MKRRSFIQKSVAAGTVLTLGPYLKANLRQSVSDKGLFIGTPVLPEYLFDKGIPETLEAMQELAGIETVMTFSHSHVFRQYNPGFASKTDDDGHPITDLFVKTHPRYYADPAFQGITGGKYAGRDILDELEPEISGRGMKVYARILEPYRITGVIHGFEEFAEINAEGGRGPNVCFNHPGYMAYWDSVVEDLVRSHPFMHGFKFGQERAGPLHESLGGHTATCFCKHCSKLAAQRGIDLENARQGNRAFIEYVSEIRKGNRPVDGNFVTFIRLLANYPHLLSLEKLWMDSREEQRKRMYKLIKRINPEIRVGWHIDHGMTWDLFTRAYDDYSKKGPYSDWLSVALYFDSMGRRSLNHYNKNYRHLLFGDASSEISYPMYLSMLEYDPAREPSLETHEKHDTPFSVDYVYRESLRAVKAVNGTAKVYARPGFDMPGYDCNVTSRQVYEAVQAALRAGVDGLWCGREWNEILPEHAAAFGKAVRDWI